MMLSTRPDWTRATKGAPIDAVVRIHGGNDGTRTDITSSRTTVSLVRPGALSAKPEDEYEVGYVYGPEASNVDVCKRSLAPLVKKFVEGYNATILCFGATGAGKTFTLEGGRSRDASRVSPDGDGCVHLVADELFKQLHQRAAAVGDQVAQRRRMPSAKAFEFFIDVSYMEVYNEGVRDLLQRGDAARAKLPVYEDELEGYQVSGLSFRHVKSDSELRTAFNVGRHMRDMTTTDLGSVHERAAAIFTIHLAQYAPAAVPGEEDRVMVSRMSFVDMPGAERLAMEPELLRLREGPQLNRGLMSFATALRELAEASAAGGAPLSGSVNVESSVLTRLLADALGGNSLVLVIGCCRQGNWELSRTCCQHLALARTSRTFPIVNHGRARGLLLLLRRRLLALMADRDTLTDQMGDLPADGDPNARAISIAKVRDLESRLLAEREEKASLLEEKQALQARLMNLRNAGTGDLAEKAELQEALIKSEELRLDLAKTLINTQMEFNEVQMGWSEEKLELEKRLADLEASHFERYVRAEDHAALEQERDALNTRLLAVQDELARREQHITELKAEIDELKQKLRKAEHELNMLGGEPGHHDYDGEDLDIDPESIEGKRRQLFINLKKKDRRIHELMQEIKALQTEVDQLRNQRALTQTGVDEMREAYRRKLEVQMRDVADLARAVAIMQEDPSTGLKVKPEDLFNAFQKLTDENLRVTDAREREMRSDLDELQKRHVELKTKFKSIVLAYRNMRYLVADRWPPGHPPLEITPEDRVLNASMEDVVRSEDNADRQLIARLRDQASQMGTQLGALKIADAAAARGIQLKPSNLAMAPRDNTFTTNKYVEMPDLVVLENEKMRQELDKLRQQLAGTPVDKLRKDNKLLSTQLKELNTDKSRADMARELAAAKLEIERLRQQMAGGIAGPHNKVSDAKSVTQQIREFQGSATAELERKLQSAEAAKLMAEEQLNSLQAYLTQATVQYQREIVRLRGVIGQMDPGGRLVKADPLRGRA